MHFVPKWHFLSQHLVTDDIYFRTREAQGNFAKKLKRNDSIIHSRKAKV